MSYEPPDEVLDDIGRGQELQKLRESPGYPTLVNMIMSELGQRFYEVTTAESDRDVLRAAWEARGLKRVLEGIDETVARAQDLGRELAERIREEEHREQEVPEEQRTHWNVPHRSHPRGRVG